MHKKPDRRPCGMSLAPTESILTGCGNALGQTLVSIFDMSALKSKLPIFSPKGHFLPINGIACADWHRLAVLSRFVRTNYSGDAGASAMVGLLYVTKHLVSPLYIPCLVYILYGTTWLSDAVASATWNLQLWYCWFCILFQNKNTPSTTSRCPMVSPHWFTYSYVPYSVFTSDARASAIVHWEWFIVFYLFSTLQKK